MDTLIGDAELAALAGRGHQLRPLDSDYGNMQAVYWDIKNRRVHAASDPRGIGAAAVGSMD